MDYEFHDGRVYVRRTAEERAKITDRLKKIEGQVRGIQRMIDEGRYCLDEIQQANAIVAAMREVELLIISDHLEASMEFAFESKDKAAGVRDMMTVLRAAIRK
jgi:DNA-binding FrmR family transcriptional regulator